MAAVIAMTTLTAAITLRYTATARVRAALEGRTDTAWTSPDARFAGSATCQACHPAQAEGWRQSQHSVAMQPATAETVLGDFSGVTFTQADVTSTFSRLGDDFLVETDATDGRLQQFRVSYTFGVEPLQQYLVEFPDGRLQALPVAWDSRPREAGGQRWMHLYPDERIEHTDELHWTGRQQNWNFMCADCHSTNVRKQYDADGNRFNTTWSEINVACEACHGPGSEHERWARSPEWLRDWWWPTNGLTAQLTERRGVRWLTDPASGRVARSAPRETSREIETCAVCHSRRSQIAEGHVAGAPLLDAYVPAPIEAGLYFPDGQQLDEVYTYGSFLQSRMFDAGVTCADCHDPHTQQLRATGNALCGQCHAADRYDVSSHHFHPPSSPGASCVSCHMPTRTYMVVDPRHDHSLRVPRPDLSVELGVPNPCRDCHADQTDAWAAERVRGWLGRDAQGFQQFAREFAAAERAIPGLAAALGAIATDEAQPAIVRASAVLRTAATPEPPPLPAVQTGLQHPHPSVRRAALEALGVLPRQVQVALGAPLLEDLVRGVRIGAAWQLASVASAFTGSADGVAFARAADEFIAAQRLVADRPEGRVTLGEFLARLGRTAEAIEAYRSAIELGPNFPPAYVGLAELYRRSGDEPQAQDILHTGLAVMPEAAGLHHALGLSLARSRRIDEAVASLGRAAALSPDEPRFAYAYAVGLHSSGRVDEAIGALETARRQHPADRDLLFALATFHRDAGRPDAARAAAEQLAAEHPNDQGARALLESLRPGAAPR